MKNKGFTQFKRIFCSLGKVKKYIMRLIGKNTSNSLSSLKGFTLIELLITIAIVGILASVALTSYVGTAKKAARSEAYSNLESLRLLSEKFFADNSDYPDPAGLTACGADTPENTLYIRQGGSAADTANDLPGFRPGNATSFSYCTEHDTDIDGNALVPCFRAQAFGNTNTRVEGDTFAIDCNNDRTF